MRSHRLITPAILLLLAVLLLVACTDNEAPAETTAGVTDTAESPADTTATDTEAESETQPPKAIVTFPDAALPDLGELLAGEDKSICLDYDFADTPMSAIKGDKLFHVVSQGDFAASAEGLVSDRTLWQSIGLNQLIPKKPYAVEAELTARTEDAAYTHTGMVGIHCRTASDLFIDGGMWFSFVGNTVTLSVRGELTYTLEGLPFKSADGIRFRSEEADGVATIFANDVQLFRITFGEERVTVYDAADTEVGTCTYQKLYPIADGNGFFRIMSHFADVTFESMKLTVEDKQAYTPTDHVYAFRDGLPYGFADMAAHTADGGVEVRRDILFADAYILARMFDFAYIADSDKHTLAAPGVTMVLCADADALEINGTTYDFTTTYRKGARVMVDVKSFAAMLGYGYAHSHDDPARTYYILADEKSLTEEKKQMLDERFDLYRDVVYNYDDIECDNTGVGPYQKTDPAKRLVGLAYTTWHRPDTAWGTATWGTPLGGGYVSDDRDRIYEHGILLRDAGVDFIFVDWSNNTDYDPVTMSNRIDFRTIEKSTDALFEVWSEIPGAPKICIFVGPGHNGVGSVTNGNHQKKVDQVWRDYVEKYPELYFHYEGKPLLICYGATPTQYGTDPSKIWDDDRYTVRWMTGYVGQQPALFNGSTLKSTRYWSWEERGTQTFTLNGRRVEAVTVSPATRPQGTEGSEGYIPPSGRQSGATFKRQFQRAMNLGAEIAIITTWNEWSSGEHPSPEVSRDIEPSEEFGTFYYDLMREQIKKFKGRIETEA